MATLETKIAIHEPLWDTQDPNYNVLPLHNFLMYKMARVVFKDPKGSHSSYPIS